MNSVAWDGKGEGDLKVERRKWKEEAGERQEEAEEGN